MDKYTAIAVVYEMAKTYINLKTESGFPIDQEDDAALDEVLKLLNELEKDSGS